MPWVNRATSPDPGAVVDAIGAPDRIYVLRGQGGNDPDLIQTYRVLQYVISTNTWTSRAIDSGATSVQRPMIAYQAGKVWVMGGVTGSGAGASTQVRAWDPTANTWAAGTAMTVNRAGGQLQAYGTTKILVFGGNTYTAGVGAVATTVYEYDTTTTIWTAKTSASSAAAALWDQRSSASFFWNNRVYIRNAGMSFSVFRTDTNAWLADQNITMAHGQLDDAFNSAAVRCALAITTQGTYLYQMERRDAYTYLFAVTDLSTWKTYGPHVYARPIDGGHQGPPDWAMAADVTTTMQSSGVFWYGSGTGSNSFFLRYRIGDVSTAVLPGVSPNGSTQQTDTPVLALSLTPGPLSIQPGFVQWQLATDSGFTANVKLVDDVTEVGLTSFSQLTNANFSPGVHNVLDFTGSPPGGFGFSGRDFSSVVEPVPSGSALSSGTWYIRGRYFIPPDEVGPWTTGVTFTVSHPPSASGVYPSGGENIQYGAFNFTWIFDDPYSLDTQSAYQIVVERTDTGAVVLDTGKVASVPARSYNWSPSATLKDILLRWKIRVYDSDDTTAGYSSYRTFRVADLPVVTVTGPAEGGTIATAKPTVTWTFSAGGGRIQTKYKVRILNAGVEVYTSGWVASAALTHTPANNILQNGITYTAEVTVEDSYGLQRTDTNAFTTSYVPPAQPIFTVSTSVYDSTGPVRVTWTNAAKDGTFVGWNVYRKMSTSSTWDLVYSTTVDQANYTFDDYTAGSGVQYNYTVVQVASRFGSNVESNKTTITTVTPSSGEYWLIVPDNTSLNTKLYIVNSEEFSSDVEQEDIQLIDRGRHVDYGTDMGYSGTLVVRLVDISGGPTARAQRLTLEAIRIARLKAVLRNPFGDVFEVAVGSMNFQRQAGVGLSEMGTMSIPYTEVAD